MSFWPFWPVWPFLLMGCAVTAIFNKPMALVFALHILSMQGIKYLALPQEQVLFFACYVVFALVAALWFDKVATSFLVIIALIYIASLMGMFDYGARTKIADVLMIFAMVIGFFNGPSGGLLVSNNSVFGTQRGAAAVVVAAYNKMHKGVD